MNHIIDNVIHIDSIVLNDITDKFDYSEYRNADSMLIVTHRYDGISEKHLRFSLHTHCYYEFELVYGGHGVQILKKSSVSMYRGFACLRTPNNLHTTWQDVNDKLKSYNIRFSVDFIPNDIASNLIADDNTISVMFDESELESMISKIVCLTNEINRPDQYTHKVISAIFLEIFITFIRKYRLLSVEKSKYSRHVQIAANYINENFRDKLNIAALADIVHLNPHYLGDLFHSEVGKSISEYILELRLILSVQLLMNSAMTVNEIAFECGFTSPAYYISKFKKRYGLPPNKYRQK